MSAAGWQPIETAPKDGTVVDLWGWVRSDVAPYLGREARRHTAEWVSDWPGGQEYWRCRMPGLTVEVEDATHWRPLPEPPE